MLHTYRGTSHFCGLHSIKVFSIEYQRVADTRISSEKFLHMSVTKKKIETSVQLTFFLFNWICLVLHTVFSHPSYGKLCLTDIFRGCVARMS